MRRSNPLRDRDGGSAAVELLTLGIVLLVPLVYLVLVLALLQGAAFAAEGAARQAARELVLAPTDAQGRLAAARAVHVGLADWRIPDADAVVTVVCTPDPQDCVRPRGTVAVTVRVGVALPLLPRAPELGPPGTLPVEAQAVERVSMFTAAR